MPRVDPAEYESLSLHATSLVRGHALHDVWLVELAEVGSPTIQDLRCLITPERMRSLSPIVRGLFWLRSALGRVFRLDTPQPRGPLSRGLVDAVPSRLAEESLVPPGTPEGPFTTLYALPTEAAFHALNATVDAVLVVALVKSNSGHHFFWATHLKPVGRITSLYMHLIDPFRRKVVYPGLESWLKRAWAERSHPG